MVLPKILSDLESEGYRSQTFLIPSYAAGGWHKRDRIWIVTIKEKSLHSNTNGKRSHRTEKYVKREIELRNKQKRFAGSVVQEGIRKGTNTGILGANNGISPELDPNRIGRLKGLGNAIVPQVAQVIFQYIMEYDSSLKTEKWKQ